MSVFTMRGVRCALGLCAISAASTKLVTANQAFASVATSYSTTCIRRDSAPRVCADATAILVPVMTPAVFAPGPLLDAPTLWIGVQDKAVGKAPTTRIGTLQIEAPWIRQPPKGARVAGGYMRITNDGPESDRLLSGSATFAKRLELHEMAVDNGVMKMRELAQGIEIKPGQTVELKPGGLHVMFMDLSAQPNIGEVQKIVLVFERAGRIEIDMPVGAAGNAAPTGKAHHH